MNIRYVTIVVLHKVIVATAAVTTVVAIIAINTVAITIATTINIIIMIIVSTYITNPLLRITPIIIIIIRARVATTVIGYGNDRRDKKELVAWRSLIKISVSQLNLHERSVTI